jgi:hypothetical protein
VGVLGATAIGAGAVAAGMGAGVFNIVRLATMAVKKKRDKRIVYRGPEAGEKGLTAGELDHLMVQLPDAAGERQTFSLTLPLEMRPRRWIRGGTVTPPSVFREEGLLPVAALALARRNRLAGRPAHIDEAVSLVDQLGNPLRDPDAAQAWSRTPGMLPGSTREPVGTTVRPLKDIPTATRLALEIAAHEEQERLFLASHLGLLQRAWQEAEEIARIADDLLLPDWIRNRLGG